MVTGVGIVREFDAEQGWGVIDGANVPGGCWVHFSAIAGHGYRRLTAGQRVSFRSEAVRDQDDYRFRATLVWPVGEQAPEAPEIAVRESSSAYSSVLSVTFSPAAES
jgi:CspA family cold shock protein